MTYLVILGILGAGAHFLLYRAEVTRWLWSRYPARLEAFLGCSACTGFWVGGAVGGALAYGWPATGGGALPGPWPTWALVPVSAVATMVLAPMVAYLQVAALTRLSGSDGTEAQTEEVQLDRDIEAWRLYAEAPAEALDPRPPAPPAAVKLDALLANLERLALDRALADSKTGPQPPPGDDGHPPAAGR